MTHWNTDMSEAPTDGRRLIVIDKWGNTNHVKFSNEVSRVFPESGPRGWVSAKSGNPVSTRFECNAAWIEAPGAEVLTRLAA